MLHESPSIRIERDDQIATLWLDVKGQSRNVLGLETLDELEGALRAVQQQPCLDILVIRSAKVAGFSPGYDLDQLARFQSPEWSAFAARGQQVTQLLANLSPSTMTVAVLEGECRSGGLELALACDYRLALARPDTILGFPEFQRGLIPCWGGTQRLPNLVGLGRGLQLLLNGQELNAREALRWGLADWAFCDRRSRIELRAILDKLQDRPRRASKPRSLLQRLRDAIAPLRWATCRQASGWLADVDSNERPAGHAILKAVRLGYSSSAEGLAAERQAVGELGTTAACRNALDLLHRSTQPAKIHPEPTNPIPAMAERIGIVGGGELGAALASWFALRGRQVVIQEQCEETLQLANQRFNACLDESRRKGLLTPLEAEQARKCVRRTTAWSGFEEASLVIESVDEDLGVKLGVFHDLEERVRPRAILASTGSTIRIEALQAELKRPGRVAGLHFLDSALANPVVEIVRSPATDSGTVAALDSWLRSWGKTPILVADRPGRVVRRVQLAYLSEAVQLVAEGLPPELIDRRVRQYGMAKGPLETIDALGFDNIARLVDNLQLARGDQFARNLLLERLRAFGWNGKDNGEGFYRYRAGQERGRENHLARMVVWRDVDEDAISHYVFDPEEALDDGLDRLVLRSINEAAACLSEEPDADPATIDLALAWGAGWAPHLGGPLRHADEMGLAAVLERLVDFTERFGKRFEPCVELQRRGGAGESFYGSRVSEGVIQMPAFRRLAG